MTLQIMCYLRNCLSLEIRTKEIEEGPKSAIGVVGTEHNCGNLCTVSKIRVQSLTSHNVYTKFISGSTDQAIVSHGVKHNA